jgi:uncharacterized protein (DUF924 family)
MKDVPASTEGLEPAWVGAVLDFWFDELSEQRWFAKDAALDARILRRFLGLHEGLLAQEDPRLGTPRTALAAVIVLDQFPRNMFRGDPRAYAADPMARRIARAAIASGFDTHLPASQRMFLYLPLQHSEDAQDQRLACALIEPLGNAEWMRYAVAHKAIIDRFGRFPHRNAVLGRRSTPEELELLKEPMGSF